MNRIICVTGSSPAYVFMMIKAMLDGAANQGLLRTDDDCGLTSKELTDCICNTIIGAAELMKSGTKSPEEQIATVASKGGTTERAISELNEYKFCEAIVSAMDKCTRRANELGKK
jgi:pyrroline-5-carboxylate reductase